MDSQSGAVSPEIVAAVLGVLGGVSIERVARSWGRLWCAPSEWELVFQRRLVSESAEWVEAPAEVANRVYYSVGLDLFNGKENPVGLRGVSVVFSCAGKPDVVSRPFTYEPPGCHVRLRTINLPPRQWVSYELEAVFSGAEEIRGLRRWYRVEFIDHRERRGLFEPKTFRKTIASRNPFPDPWREYAPCY